MSVLGWEVLQGCLYQEGIYYMKRVGLVVAYDGTKYSGWQTQPNGITIQGVLNDTLSELLGEKIETIGASRTDAGVHALGNVAVFDTDFRRISVFSCLRRWSRIFIPVIVTVKKHMNIVS